MTIIEDDGVGFNPEEAMSRGRLGLFGMRERVQELGGSLVVESAAAAGTTIFVQVPLNGENLIEPTPAS
jgi:signal transduction histidine kinase